MHAIRLFLITVMFLVSPTLFAQGEATTMEIPLINKTLTIKAKKATYFFSFAAKEGSHECAVGDAVLQLSGPIMNNNDLVNVRASLATMVEGQCRSSQIHIISMTRLD
jgi:hypothetical protein